MFSRISPEKAQDRLLKALALWERRPDFPKEGITLLISGEAAYMMGKHYEKELRRVAARRKIRTELAKGPATVPALAGVCGITPREVLWHVAAMRKYGELTEDAQEGDYFTYRLVQGKGTGD